MQHTSGTALIWRDIITDIMDLFWLAITSQKSISLTAGLAVNPKLLT